MEEPQTSSPSVPQRDNFTPHSSTKATAGSTTLHSNGSLGPADSPVSSLKTDVWDDTSPGASGGKRRVERLSDKELKIPGWKDRLALFVDSIPFQIFMMLLLGIALFLVDIVRLESLNDDVDPIINSLLCAVFACFVLEIALQMAVKPNYFLSFYFWMDLIGTASIVTDITWFSEGWLEEDRGSTTLRASKAARIGARAGRVTRLIRLFRVLKVFRMYSRVVNKEEEKAKLAPTSMALNLSESVSHQVAALVLVTVLLMPFLTFVEDDTAPAAFLTSFELAVDLPEAQVDELVDSYLDFFRGTFTKPVQLAINSNVVAGCCYYDFEDTNGGYTPRSGDKLEIGDFEDDGVVMGFNVADKNHEEALLNILLVIVVIVELIAFSTLLNGTCNKLLVAPLERIFHMIQTNATQVMGALQLDGEEGEGTDEMGAIEAAINKMTKLVAHVSSNNNQGTNLLKNHLEGQAVDDETRKWLLEYATTGVGAKKERVSEVKSEDLQRKADIAVASLPEEESVDENGSPLKRIESMQSVESDSAFPASVDIDPGLINTWNLDVLMQPPEHLFAHVHRMFVEMGIFKARLCTPVLLHKFLTQVRPMYRPNSYHNFEHACDVTHTLYRFLKITNARGQYNVLERFALLVAALCHDMDHPGVNNAFLVNTKDELALSYNDKSVLENRHIACLYSLVTNHPDADIFKLLDDEQWREVRRLIIEAVLHTDMVHHFSMVSQVEVFWELHGEEIARFGTEEQGESLYTRPEDRNFLFGLLLHSADVSNSLKPWSICTKWAAGVLDEFFDQGDKERAAGLPVSPMCDRATTSRGLSQINFIEFVLAPLYASFTKLFPELDSMLAVLSENRRRYGLEYEKEVDAWDKTQQEKDEEKAKMKTRYENFVNKFNLARFQKDVLGAGSSLSGTPKARARSGSVIALSGSLSGGRRFSGSQSSPRSPTVSIKRRSSIMAGI